MAHSFDQSSIKAKNGEAEQLHKPKALPTLSPAEPPQDKLNALIMLFNQGQLDRVVRQATAITAEFPKAVILFNILGAANAGLRNLDEAIANFSKAIQIKPDYAEAHNSLGIALQGQGLLDEAVASYGKALQIKPDFAEAHNNLGGVLKDQGRLDEAIVSYGKALKIKPDFAQAHNNLGIALKDQGRLEDAIACYGKALKIKPDFAQAHNNLGIALQDRGRLEEAIASFSRALQIKPDYVGAHNSLGILLHDQGRLEEAIASFSKALKIKPDFAEVHNNLGIALQDRGRLEEAIACYGKALKIKADFAQAHNNLGIALHGRGRLEEAIACYGKALNIKPDYVEAHNSLGIALKDQGRLDESKASIIKALQIKPDFAEAHNSLGIVLQDQGRLDEAKASIIKALQIKPDFAEAHNSLGVVLQDQGRLKEAIASYGKALEIKPDYAGAHSNLCELYETQNNIGEFESALENAVLNCGKDNSEILFRLAQLANRKEQFDYAVGYLRRVDVERIRPSLKSAYFSLLGKVCDKLGQFEEAFSAFEKQNELTRASVKAKKFNADRYLNLILLSQRAWATDVKPIKSDSMIGRNQASPTFLIGFPRSGTTLLDTILRSHSGISVVEEKPMVGMMSKAFRQTQKVQVFGSTSEAEVLGLRDVYFKELKIHLDQDYAGKLIVDKFPLNIVNIGIIHRAFPDAKFILVLRHPCDCVLSCFMQTFKLNDAMANFLSLDQSAKLYAAVMELWSIYRQKLNLNVHVLKYEDLVQDLEGTCKSLISFLGLEWDNNLHNYQKTALDRSNIRTPSYDQVIQPLYKHASGRWINYRAQMQPVLPVLRPWIESFGY